MLGCQEDGSLTYDASRAAVDGRVGGNVRLGWSMAAALEVEVDAPPSLGPDRGMPS